MIDEKLLPCPFCGGQNTVVRSNGIGDYYVICDGDEDELYCGASTSDRKCETIQHAMDRWNTRTPNTAGGGVVDTEFAEAMFSACVYLDKAIPVLGRDNAERVRFAADEILRLRAALASKAEGCCVWNQDDEGSNTFGTSCGHWFVLNDGSPEENHMKHCCYCGKPIEQSLWTDEEIPPAGEEGGV